MCRYYYDTQSYKSFLSCADEAREAGLATEQVRDWYLEVYYTIRYLATGFEEAQSFLGSVARVKKNGFYGYLTSYGDYLIAPLFLDASPFMNSTAAVKDKTEWYMINDEGYKVARTTTPVDGLSFPSGGKILLQSDGKYGYTGFSLVVPDELPYDFATNFKNGVAAVCRNGKWALINSDEQFITEFVFDDVVVDEYGACINNGVVFAKESGKYYLYSAEGNRISDQGFDEAYPFCTGEPAAVRLGSKWKFIDASGSSALDKEFDEAKSFSMGLAPVREGATWGYINTKGEYRVERQFQDAKPFTENGVAVVKENGVWNYIKLLAFY